MRSRNFKINFITLLFLVLQLPVMGHSLFHEQMHSFIQSECSDVEDKRCDCVGFLGDHDTDEESSSCGIETDFVSSRAAASETESMFDGVDIPLCTISFTNNISIPQITQLCSRCQFCIDDSPLIGDLTPLCISLRAPPLFN